MKTNHLVLLSLSSIAHGFVAHRDEKVRTTFLQNSRRDFLAAAATSSFLLLTQPVSPVLADDNEGAAVTAPIENKPLRKKVLVLGGTGFVGSEVVRQLKERNIDVIATSTNGRDGTAALDFTNKTFLKDEVAKLAEGCTAVISCVGSIGHGDADEVVNAGTGIVAQSVKSIKSIDQFVYIGVAPEVKDAVKGVKQLDGYMKGKEFSLYSIATSFDKGHYSIINPTFIYGGDEFKLNPPRVAGFYGEFIEGVLSTGVFRFAANVLPGILGVACEPPVSVQSVAKAAVTAALCEETFYCGRVFNKHDEIVAAADM